MLFGLRLIEIQFRVKYLFVFDDLKSLEKTIDKLLNESVHQKCIVHLVRSILAKVRSKHKEEITVDFKLLT